MSENIHAIGKAGPHKVLADLMRDQANIDSMIVAVAYKDGEAAVRFANVDARTSCYLHSLVGWAIQGEMEIEHEE